MLFLKRLVFAALLTSDVPLKTADFLPLDDSLTTHLVFELLKQIQHDCQNSESVLDLVETAEGFRLQTKADLAKGLEKWHRPKNVKLSRATMEILAIIAHRQPASRGDIEKIRGVAVNPNALQLLLAQGWIESLGQRDSPGKPEVFGTTQQFLSYLGLKKLSDLPPLILES